MIRKICPICDNCVGALNYCRTCHQIIWRPERRERRYYLNESHPAEEEHCEYHQDSDYRQSGYGAGGYGSGRGDAGSTYAQNGTGQKSGTGSGANGKMTKADYLAKKAAQAALEAQKINSSVLSGRKAGQSGTWGGQEKSGQAAGSFRSDWNKMMKGQTEKGRQKKGNPGMQFLVIILIYLFFSFISSVLR